MNQYFKKCNLTKILPAISSRRQISKSSFENLAQIPIRIMAKFRSAENS